MSKYGRIPKKDKYQNERNEIITKMNSVLGITETNNMFYVCDMDSEKQGQILSFSDDIKAVFRCSTWPLFANRIKSRQYLSLIKSLYKAMGYDIIPTTKTVKRNDKLIRCTAYIINKKISM